MIQDAIMNELQHIPEDKLFELYDLIHYFRLGLNSEKPVSSSDTIIKNSEKEKAIMEIARSCASLPVLDNRTPDEILGYAYSEMGLWGDE